MKLRLALNLLFAEGGWSCLYLSSAGFQECVTMSGNAYYVKNQSTNQQGSVVIAIVEVHWFTGQSIS